MRGIHNIVIHRLNINRSNVIGQQDDFVGMDFVLVFVGQLCGADEAALQQAGDKRAGPCKRVDDVDIFIAQCLPEFVLQRVIDAVEYKIDHFYGGIDDAQAFSHAWEGVAEKLVVQFYDDLLFTCGVVDAFGTHFYAVIEALQGVGFFVDMMFMQLVQDVLHGNRHGVVLGKAVILEQGIKHGLGNQVLCQHFDDFTIGNGVVEVVAQFMGKGVKGDNFCGVGGRT